MDKDENEHLLEEVTITFTSKQDFRNRIVGLMQDELKGERYCFEFPDKETEEEFDRLERAFLDGNSIPFEEENETQTN